MELIAFPLITLAVVLIPGPNILVIISTSISHGRARGLQTVAGTSTAMIIQMVTAAFATTGLVVLFAQGLQWLKWIGIFYLVYLGLQNFKAVLRDKNTNQLLSPTGPFQRGFWVSLTNPKTIVFFSAYLPQFVDPSRNYLSQIIILSMIFWLLAVIVDSSYALLSSKLYQPLTSANVSKVRDGIVGSLYLGAAALLAGLNNK